MNVCMYVCMYACDIYIYIYIFVQIYLCIHIRAHSCASARFQTELATSIDATPSCGRMNPLYSCEMTLGVCLQDPHLLGIPIFLSFSIFFSISNCSYLCLPSCRTIQNLHLSISSYTVLYLHIYIHLSTFIQIHLSLYRSI